MKRTSSPHRLLACSLIALSALVLFSGCSRVRLTVTRLAPPQYHIVPGKRLAILPFEGTFGRDDAGEAMAGALLAHLAPAGYYQLVERQRIKQIIDEQNFTRTDYVDPSTAAKIGAIIGAEYLISGTVTGYSVEDTRSTEYVSQWRNTGRRDKDGNDIYEQVKVPQPALVRNGSVSADFRLLSVTDGTIIASSVESETFHSRAVGTGNIARIPPTEQVLRDLTNVVAGRFFAKISAHPVQEQRVLFKGKTPQCKQAVQLAMNGLWSEAMNLWQSAAQIRPDDFAPYHNMGVAAEVSGRYDEAEAHYRKALSLAPTNNDIQIHLRTVQNIQSELASAP